MRTIVVGRQLIVALALSFVLSSVASAAKVDERKTDGAIVIEWNQLLQQNLGTLPPFPQTRNYAILHVAIADAVAAIEDSNEPFHAQVWAPRGASAKAAAAQAGHDVLVSLITTPAARTAADALLAAQLEKLPRGSREVGAWVGGRAAAQILDWRTNDGYATANPQPPLLALSQLPGIWRPTATGSFIFSAIGEVIPFGLLTPTQFLPTPFPQLESEDYADAVNEVKRVGRLDAAPGDRSPEQTRFSQLFASVGPYANATNPFRLWANVARDMSIQKSLSLARTARLFALMHVSIHDSLQLAQHSKAVYRLWRPETAIARADIDDNPETLAEPGWVPLVPTPAYPAYASNMTCIGAGASRMLANVLGSDAQQFNAVWYSAAGAEVWKQPYTSLWQLGVDEAESRITGGIHFRFDIDAAQVSCTQVADWLYRHYMRPTRREH